MANGSGRRAPGLPPSLRHGAIAGTLGSFVVVEAIAGARRSPLVPMLPRGAAVPGWTMTLARWLSIRDASATRLAVLAIAVVATACGCLAIVLAEAWRGRIGVRAVAVASVAAAALAVAGPVLLSRDVTSYAAYGRMLAFHRANPYVHAPAAFPHDPYTPAVSREWLHTRSVYGPVFTLLSAALVRLGGSDADRTLLLFRSVGAASALGAAALGADIARRRWPGRQAFAVALVGLNPVVVIHTIGGGHNDALMALLLTAGAWVAVVAAGRTGPRPSGQAGQLVVTLLLTLAVLVKAVGAVPLVLWLVGVAAASSSPRARILGAHLVLLALTSLLWFAPFFAGAATIHPIVGAAGRQGWASPAALVGRLAARAVGPAVATMIKAIFVCAFVLLAAFAVRFHLSRRNESPNGARRSLVFKWGTVMLLFTLAIPYLLPWYAMWFLPLLPFADDHRSVAIGGALSALLALTGVPAEPTFAPAAWHDMVSAVHYGAAAVALGLGVLLAIRFVHQGAGAITTSRSPNARA